MSSYEPECYPRTSLDKNCIEIQFQTDRNFYDELRQLDSYLALNLKLVKSRGYDAYNTKEVKEAHKEKPKEPTETGETQKEEEDAPVPLVTHVNSILHSVFSNVKLYINNRQIHNSNGLYAHKSYLSNNFQGASFENTRVLHCEWCDYEEGPDEIVDAPLFEHFFTRRMKMLTRSNGFMLYGKLGVDFFSSSELLFLIFKNRLQFIRVKTNFYRISDKPSVNLGNECSSTLVVLLSRMIITGKK